MKQLLRILACILLCAVLLPRWTSPAHAAFRDVPASSWAADTIDRAVSAGLIQGRTTSTFGMGEPMTRGAFVTVLGRFFGWETVTPAAATFEDTPAEVWCFSAVETAVANGAVTRQSEQFRPGDAITREEMAVMLVRALGYASIAGLDQGLPCPFTDVTTNRGYLTMAYYLGISTGVTADTFAPERTASREQAVVMLMRIYDRYLRDTPSLSGVTSGTDDLPGLSGYDTAAIPAARLSDDGSGQVLEVIAAQQAQSLQEAIRAAGARPLLRITGSEYSLSGDIAAAARAIAEAVTAGGYDGVLLDIPGLPVSRGGSFTALTAALRAALPDAPLHVAAEAPSCDGDAFGYQYAALAEQADRLILRTASVSRLVNQFPTAPQDALEDIYYALAVLRGSVDPGKLSLWITSTGSSWQGAGAAAPADGETISSLLAAGDTEDYYSTRYASAYLVQSQNGWRTVVWYNDARAAADKARLCALFGVSSFCLSDLSSVTDAEWSPVKGLLS